MARNDAIGAAKGVSSGHGTSGDYSTIFKSRREDGLVSVGGNIISTDNNQQVEKTKKPEDISIFINSNAFQA